MGYARQVLDGGLLRIGSGVQSNQARDDNEGYKSLYLVMHDACNNLDCAGSDCVLCAKVERLGVCCSRITSLGMSVVARRAAP